MGVGAVPGQGRCGGLRFLFVKKSLRKGFEVISEGSRRMVTTGFRGGGAVCMSTTRKSRDKRRLRVVSSACVGQHVALGGLFAKDGAISFFYVRKVKRKSTQRCLRGLRGLMAVKM